jgi:hypothetical protein
MMITKNIRTILNGIQIIIKMILLFAVVDDDNDYDEDKNNNDGDDDDTAAACVDLTGVRDTVEFVVVFFSSIIAVYAALQPHRKTTTKYFDNDIVNELVCTAKVVLFVVVIGIAIVAVVGLFHVVSVGVVIIALVKYGKNARSIINR